MQRGGGEKSRWPAGSRRYGGAARQGRLALPRTGCGRLPAAIAPGGRDPPWPAGSRRYGVRLALPRTRTSASRIGGQPRRRSGVRDRRKGRKLWFPQQSRAFGFIGKGCQRQCGRVPPATAFRLGAIHPGRLEAGATGARLARDGSPYPGRFLTRKGRHGKADGRNVGRAGRLLSRRDRRDACPTGMDRQDARPTGMDRQDACPTFWP